VPANAVTISTCLLGRVANLLPNRSLAEEAKESFAALLLDGYGFFL